MPSPSAHAVSAFVVALVAGGFHTHTFAQDRRAFEAATAKLCMQDAPREQAAASGTGTDGRPASSGQCACYAAELARTVPADILNTSQSAATPAQARLLQDLAGQASRKCGPAAVQPQPAAS